MPRTLATNRTLVKNYGTSLSFNGSTSFVNIFSAGLQGALNTTEGSISAWVKIPTSVWTDGVGRLCVRVFVDASNLINFTKAVASNFFNMVYTAGGTSKTASIALSATGWVHLVMTFSKTNDQVKGYLNGIQSGVTATSLGTWAGTPSILCIGAASTVPVSPFSGFIDDVKLYNRPLTAAEVLQTYIGSDITSGLIAWYKFDEGSGSTANDSSGNGYNGAITVATYSTDVSSQPRVLSSGRTLASGRALAV